MRGLLYIRLFFAFVPRSAREGKRRDFISKYGNSIFQAMPHCAGKSRARQSMCLCIASEIVAKLFDFLVAKFFTASRLRCSEKCAALREARIEILSVSPE
jgi:hypothetical protein